MIHTPQTIEAVRRCAESGMSASQAATALNFPSRSAVLGVANRNGITFKSVGQVTGRPRTPALGSLPGSLKPAPLSPLGLHVVTPKRDWKPKAPTLRCSWFGCVCDARAEDIFCREHSGRPLMG